MASSHLDQHATTALKRLNSDFKELQRSPIMGVSAAPLEDNIFEWHCNFCGPQGSSWEGAVFHVILFFSGEYPAKSPSAEFVPREFIPIGGATKTGTKGRHNFLVERKFLANLFFEFRNKGMFIHLQRLRGCTHGMEERERNWMVPFLHSRRCSSKSCFLPRRDDFQSILQRDCEKKCSSGKRLYLYGLFSHARQAMASSSR